MQAGRDVWWHDTVDSPARPAQATPCATPKIRCSCSTPRARPGRPKGLVHTCGGYLTWVAYTHALSFDLREDDVFACVADIGWITGHSYIVYGPLCNGATTLDVRVDPDLPRRRSLLGLVARHHDHDLLHGAHGDPHARGTRRRPRFAKHDLSSLRVLGTVGEPIDPVAWHWYYEVVGQGRCADRRHLVADRDRRPLHHPDRPRDPRPSPVRRPCRCRGSCPRCVDGDGRAIGRPRRGSAVPRAPLARARADRLGRPRALRRDLLRPVRGPLLHRRRLPPRRRRLLLDHRPGRRRAQRLRPPHGHRRVRGCAGRGRRDRRGRGGRVPARASRARACTPTWSCSLALRSTRPA